MVFLHTSSMVNANILAVSYCIYGSWSNFWNLSGPYNEVSEKRELIEHDRDRKVWVFCGDGEMDEPESKGALGLAGRENLTT